jgi:drug/metabolite transporter (DMT)-like permease
MNAKPRQSRSRTIALTAAAMFAFAGNSIVCRLALKDGSIDPATFTALRLFAGAATLLLIYRLSRGHGRPGGHGGWLPAAMLFCYAACFSFAYTSLSAGAGALILFGFVQATMISHTLWSGTRPRFREWAGWALAAAGLTWLLVPGVEAPSPGGAAMMAIAGIGWGVYSIRGRRESDALAATAWNFTLSLAFAGVLIAVFYGQIDVNPRGAALAVLSGAATSGIGYVIWYAALTGLTGMQAALVQLSVPAIAAGAGALLLSEPLTARLLISSALVLGGISVALGARRARA